MIDEVSDTLGWDRKHAIKALNGKVSLGRGARKRGSKAIYTEEVKEVVVDALAGRFGSKRKAARQSGGNSAPRHSDPAY